MKSSSALGIAAIALLLGSLRSASAFEPKALRVQDPADKQERRTPPTRIEKGQTCLGCHQEEYTARRVHKPVRTGDCTLCHTQPDPERHIFVPPADMGAVCRDCHTLPQRVTRHKPFVEGQCLECHRPHESDQRYLLRTPTDRELCGRCHTDQLGTQSAFVHGPVASGSCLLCHTPHASVEPHLLKGKGPSLCLQCHADMRERIETATSVHPPVQQECSLCHDAHSSDEEFQLRRKATTICLDCHQPLLDDIANRPVHHAALDTDEGCLACHDVHASPLPKLLKRPIGETCLSCHDGPTQRPDGTLTQGIGELLRKSKYPHGPVAEGNCAACHEPHGSQVFSLLREPYPKTFYAPFAKDTYGLCFHCHDASAFLLKETDKLTGFRNGTDNLHFVHVNREEKGRTCRACHETHASNHPLHIRDSVPFGDWKLPIGYEKTKTGGSCSPGCHAPRGYDRQNAIPLPLEQAGRPSGKADAR